MFYSTSITVTSSSRPVIVMTDCVNGWSSRIEMLETEVITGVWSFLRMLNVAMCGAEVRAGEPPSVALIVICKKNIFRNAIK